jgi:hypothetical protein
LTARCSALDGALLGCSVGLHDGALLGARRRGLSLDDPLLGARRPTARLRRGLA